MYLIKSSMGQDQPYAMTHELDQHDFDQSRGLPRSNVLCLFYIYLSLLQNRMVFGRS